MDFSGRTVRLLRQFNGWTAKQLGVEVSASPSTITSIERGTVPTGSLLAALATVLRVKPEFFWVSIADEFTEENCNFRKGQTSAERLRKRVLAQATLFSHVIRTIALDIQFPKEDVPRIHASTDEEVEAAANACRMHWGFGLDRPIKSVGRALENAGIMLARLRDDETAQLDAFSRPSDSEGPSYIVLNPMKGSTSRVRFDMAHELGHLVLHSVVRPDYKTRELQADRFASAFLLPREGFVREFPSHGRVSWGSVFEIKRRWGVSAQAIVYRASVLGLIDAVELRRAFKYISMKGWRRNEPEEPAPESPELFRRAMAALWESRGQGAAQLAERIGWSASILEDVTGFRSKHPGSTGAPLPDPKIISMESRRLRA